MEKNNETKQNNESLKQQIKEDNGALNKKIEKNNETLKQKNESLKQQMEKNNKTLKQQLLSLIHILMIFSEFGGTVTATWFMTSVDFSAVVIVDSITSCRQRVELSLLQAK